MADQYAQINFDTLQMVNGPRLLPTRWTTSTGATINNFSSLGQSVLYALGWVPVVYEEITDTESYELRSTPTYDEENKQFLYEAVVKDIDLLKTKACLAIDTAASEASAKYVTDGIGQEMRYLNKLAEVKGYLAAIEAGEAPDINDYPILQAEADAMGETDYAAYAQTISDAAAAWLVVAASIEAARISGKTAVNAAETNAAVIEARNDAITALEAI